MGARKIWVLLSVVALFVASCAAEDESSVVTEMAPTTTSTAGATSTTDVPAAQALEWSQSFDVPDSFDVRSIVWAHDRFYALGTDSGGSFYGPSALWVSDDGMEWDEVDMTSFGDGATVNALVPGDDGLLGLGFLPDGDGHAATAWYSSDGTKWRTSDMGFRVDPPTKPFTTNILWFGASTIGSDGVVVTATAHPAFDWKAAQAAVVDVLPGEYSGIDTHRLGMTPESVDVTIGPFTVFSESYAELGLDDVQEAQRITNSPAAAIEERPLTFLSSDFETWSVSEDPPVDDGYLQGMVAIGDEYLVFAGRAIYASPDGRQWESVGEVAEYGGIFEMGGELIVDGWDRDHRVMMTSSDAGRSWNEVLGPNLEQFWLTAVGPAGILATGTEDEFNGWGPAEPVEIEVDGHTVTFDEASQEFTVVDVDGTTVLESALSVENPMWAWGFTPPDEMVFDFSAETVMLSDPSTGDLLVTLTFADLDQLAEGMISYGGEQLAFSPDGQQWTVSPRSEAFDVDSFVNTACVGHDRVVASVGRTESDALADEAIWVGIPMSSEAAPVRVATELPEVVMNGPVLAWQKVLDLDGGVSSMKNTRFGVWATTGDAVEPDGLWFSSDGFDWTEVDIDDLFGDTATVFQIADGGPGLVAVGLRRSGTSREVVAWTSVDGEAWEVSPLGYTLPERESPTEIVRLFFEHLAASPSGAVVAASVWEGLDFEALEPNVQAALPEKLREYATGMGVMIDPWNISVSVGPFQVFTESVDNLDVDRDLFDAYERAVTASSPPTTILFVTEDFTSWQRVDWPDEDEFVTALTATPDGYLADVRAGWFEGGPFSSPDGITWVETQLPADPGTISWFGTAGERRLMRGELDGSLVIWELRGTTWELWASLPDHAWEVRAGGLGLVAWGEDDSDPWDPMRWESTVVESGGYTMTVASGRGGLSIVDAGGNTVVTADLTEVGFGGPEGLALPDFIVADNERAMFTVSDLESGETLFEVSYRKMQDAFDDTQPFGGPDGFVFSSSDGRVWSTQAFVEIVGDAGWISEVVVADDFAVIGIEGSRGDELTLWRGTR